MRFIASSALAASLVLGSVALAQAEGHPFDKDADQRVSLQEWMDAGTERRADLEVRLARAQPEVIEANFRSVDSNGDGYLDADELAVAKAARDKAEAEAKAAK